MVTAPSSISPGPASGRPDVVGGRTDPRHRVTPATGVTRPPTGSWLNPNVDQAATAGSAPISRASREVGWKLLYPPSACSRTSQFQPYSRGWLTIRPRLAPNTAVATTAVTAATDPATVTQPEAAASAGPPATAFRLPSTAGAGSPAAIAACATSDGRGSEGPPTGRAACTARLAASARMAPSSIASTAAPAPSTSGSAANPSAGSYRRTGPTGASGDSSTAPATASTTMP